MRRCCTVIGIVSFGLLYICDARASWELAVGNEYRWFPNHSINASTGAHVSIETDHNLGPALQLTTKTYARLDSRDKERTHADVREFWLHGTNGAFELGAGITQEFWGVTESHHLVNILNQIDAVEDIDGEDFLGQLMLKVAWSSSTMELAAYILPYFRERQFHEAQEPLSQALIVQHSIFESSANEWHTDLASRWSTQFDWLDLGLSYFHGTDREPVLNPIVVADKLALAPTYQQISQFGIDAQVTTDTWLWKLEAIRRHGYDSTFTAWVLGFEYTFFRLAQTNTDLGLIVERLKDQRDASAPPTLFADDYFVGLRVGFNNISGTQLIFGAYIDNQSNEQVYRFELEHRLNDVWSIQATANVMQASRPEHLLYPFKDDDYLSLSVTARFGSQR